MSVLDNDPNRPIRWMGFGVTDQKGNGMSGSDLSIAFFAEDSNSTTVGDYWTSTRSEPFKDPGSNDVTLINWYRETASTQQQQRASAQGDRLVVIWERPYVATDPLYDRPINTTVPSLECVAAFGRGVGTFPWHGRQDRAVFLLDLSRAAATSITSNPSSMLIAHAVLMSVGVAVFMLCGVLVATFLSRGVSNWVPLHIILQVLSVVLVIVGFSLVVAFVSERSPWGAHFDLNPYTAGPTKGAHQFIGLFLFIAIMLQALLGLVTVLVGQGKLPDKVHWWFGRFVILLSIAQVFLGIAEFSLPVWVYGVYAAYYGLVLILAIVLFIRFYRGNNSSSSSVQLREFSKRD